MSVGLSITLLQDIQVSNFVCSPSQARSQEFAMGGGLFWRLETIANDLDPDFDQSLIRLRRLFVNFR